MRLRFYVALLVAPGLNASTVPWLSHENESLKFSCKRDVATVSHFFLDCAFCETSSDSTWSNQGKSS